MWKRRCEILVALVVFAGFAAGLTGLILARSREVQTPSGLAKPLLRTPSPGH